MCASFLLRFITCKSDSPEQDFMQYAKLLTLKLHKYCLSSHNLYCPSLHYDNFYTMQSISIVLYLQVHTVFMYNGAVQI